MGDKLEKQAGKNEASRNGLVATSIGSNSDDPFLFDEKYSSSTSENSKTVVFKAIATEQNIMRNAPTKPDQQNNSYGQNVLSQDQKQSSIRRSSKSDTKHVTFQDKQGNESVSIPNNHSPSIHGKKIMGTTTDGKYSISPSDMPHEFLYSDIVKEKTNRSKWRLKFMKSKTGQLKVPVPSSIDYRNQKNSRDDSMNSESDKREVGITEAEALGKNERQVTTPSAVIHEKTIMETDKNTFRMETKSDGFISALQSLYGGNDTLENVFGNIFQTSGAHGVGKTSGIKEKTIRKNEKYTDTVVPVLSTKFHYDQNDRVTPHANNQWKDLYQVAAHSKSNLLSKNEIKEQKSLLHAAIPPKPEIPLVSLKRKKKRTDSRRTATILDELKERLQIHDRKNVPSGNSNYDKNFQKSNALSVSGNKKSDTHSDSSSLYVLQELHSRLQNEKRKHSERLATVEEANLRYHRQEKLKLRPRFQEINSEANHGSGVFFQDNETRENFRLKQNKAENKSTGTSKTSNILHELRERLEEYELPKLPKEITGAETNLGRTGENGKNLFIGQEFRNSNEKNDIVTSDTNFGGKLKEISDSPNSKIFKEGASFSLDDFESKSSNLNIDDEISASEWTNLSNNSAMSPDLIVDDMKTIASVGYVRNERETSELVDGSTFPSKRSLLPENKSTERSRTLCSSRANTQTHFRNSQTLRLKDNYKNLVSRDSFFSINTNETYPEMKNVADFHTGQKNEDQRAMQKNSFETIYTNDDTLFTDTRYDMNYTQKSKNKKGVQPRQKHFVSSIFSKLFPSKPERMTRNTKKWNDPIDDINDDISYTSSLFSEVMDELLNEDDDDDDSTYYYRQNRERDFNNPFPFCCNYGEPGEGFEYRDDDSLFSENISSTKGVLRRKHDGSLWKKESGKST
eukprot:CAMPEP_0194281300 /NCGR_PEP_ID=MMETSP0169-20130528/20444_1 /TAXON_ID=218684 /ORGANISM="Corethron pennatum, Strain L29A3" /LENGTH=909 /DNA_ID=CAMNT_0039026321 /DNA_START=90 /DNA_END=2816 /DNA_ORIENTATION=-